MNRVLQPSLLLQTLRRVVPMVLAALGVLLGLSGLSGRTRPAMPT